MGIDNDGTQQVLWRIDHGTLDGISPRLIILLIGINNLGNDIATPEEVRDGVAAILGRLRLKTLRAKVLVLGLLPYGYPGTSYGESIGEVNQLLAGLADGESVYFLDIGPELLVDGKISVERQHDFAHLTPLGYEIYARAVDGIVRELLDEKS